MALITSEALMLTEPRKISRINRMITTTIRQIKIRRTLLPEEKSAKIFLCSTVFNTPVLVNFFVIK